MENTQNQEAARERIKELLQKAKAEQKTEIKVPNDFAQKFLQKVKELREKRVAELAQQEQKETPVE